MSGQTDKERRQERLNDVCHVMSTVQGRRFVLDLVAESGQYRSSFANNSNRTAFNEGRRDMALRILSDVEIACPDQYALAKKEYERRRRLMPNEETAQPNTAAGDEQQTGLLSGDAEPAAEAEDTSLLGADSAPGEQPEGEKPAGDGEGGDEKPEEPAGAPEKYEDFTLPEGITLSEEAMGRFTPLAKETGLTQENAQKFIDLATEHVQSAFTAQAQALVDLKKDLQAKSKADPEFVENRKLALVALETFADDDTRAIFTDAANWIGDHPGMIKFLAAVGKKAKEAAQFDSNHKKPPRTLAQRIYPDNP